MATIVKCVEVTPKPCGHLIVGLDQRTEGVGFGELVPKENVLGSVAFGGCKEVQLIRTEGDRLDDADVWSYLFVEEVAVLGASLHRERKGGERPRPRVDLGAV